MDAELDTSLKENMKDNGRMAFDMDTETLKFIPLNVRSTKNGFMVS